MHASLASLCRTLLWSLAVVAFALPASSQVARADRVANSNEPIIVVDDLTNRSVTVISGAAGSSFGGTDGSFGDGSADAGAGDTGGGDDLGVGYGNNGHGNNDDGVDSSNPGEGSGQYDASCPTGGECIDDESSSGSSSPGG